jgi:hypothetical protein
MVSDRTHSEATVAEQWPPAGCAGCADSDHAKPRFAHLNPDRHKSFDGNIGFQIIYGKRPTFDIDVFERVCAAVHGLLAGEGRSGRSPARPVISRD